MASQQPKAASLPPVPAALPSLHAGLTVGARSVVMRWAHPWTRPWFACTALTTYTASQTPGGSPSITSGFATSLRTRASWDKRCEAAWHSGHCLPACRVHVAAHRRFMGCRHTQPSHPDHTPRQAHDLAKLARKLEDVPQLAAYSCGCSWQTVREAKALDPAGSRAQPHGGARLEHSELIKWGAR
eukprot:scaffold1374_cov115-Isochrysis_galbana.AAC.2